MRLGPSSHRLLAFFLLIVAILLPASTALAQVTFFVPPTFTEGANLFVADFNGDGKPDLLASTPNVTNPAVQLGNGDGTFHDGVAPQGTVLAVADFNGDGKPDLLEQGTGTLQALLGNGDGTFQSAISTNSGGTLSLVAAADLNGDGKADVAGVLNGNLLVYLGNGDGTFNPGVSYTIPLSAGEVVSSLIFGDLNGDLNTDVVVITQNTLVAGQVITLLGNGDGTLQAAQSSTGVLFPGSTAIADFDEDGNLDLMISTSTACGTTCGITPNVSLLLGNGDGTFQAPSSIVSENGTLSEADINADGHADLLLNTQGLLQVYLGNGDGTFSNLHNYNLTYNLGDGQPATVTADFNLDGNLDVASGNHVLLGNGDGTFQGSPAVQVAPSAGVLGDFDKSGSQDVAVTTNSQSSPSVDILLNDGTGSLSDANSYALPSTGSSIGSADFDGDGNLDLAAVAGAFPNPWTLNVLLGNGDGSFASPLIADTGTASAAGSEVLISDFNGDSKMDVAIPQSDGNLAVVLGNGDGTFGSPATYSYSTGSVCCATLVGADFNGDGFTDIVVSGNSGIGILLGNGDGTFQPATFLSTPVGSLLTVDLNGDGKADLIVSGGVNIQVLLGNGDGTFSSLSPIVVPGTTTASAVGLADINGDGILDLLAEQDTDSGGAGGVTDGVYLGNGDGTFGTFIPVTSPGPHTAVQNFLYGTDMDGDGKQDLVFGGPTTVWVLTNTTVQAAGVSFSPPSITFSSQAVGTSSGASVLTLTNTGAVALAVSSITISGDGAPAFSQTNNCTTVQPNQTCTINVTFTPTAVGLVNANVVVADNAGTGSQTVVLAGTGTSGASDFSITPDTGVSTSATITAGSSAVFNLLLVPSGSFNGTVTLGCTVSPVVTDEPACSVPATVDVTTGTSAPFSVTVSTTAPSTSGALAGPVSPSTPMPLTVLLSLTGGGLLLIWSRRRIPSLAGAALLLLCVVSVGCGSGNSSSSSSSTTTPGTPSNTYTLTVTATSGSEVHTTTLTVIVQ